MNIPSSNGSAGVKSAQHRVPRLGAILIFGVAALVLAALIWMGVEGVGFPTWLLALTTVL